MANTQNPSDPLSEQLEYYRARAGEYDQWWLRTGRYDRGPELNTRWAAEGKQVSEALVRSNPGGKILELACGTGIWTEKLLPFAAELTAVDGSSEMLAINAGKLSSPRVHYVQADLFQWMPDRKFDFVFFGFWLSHVPPERFEEFWAKVASCLAPRGRVFFLDSQHEQTSTAKDHRLSEPEATILRRRLNDGREFQIYKIFYEPSKLEARLNSLGWNFQISQTDHYFIYGVGGGRTEPPF
jgi:demethylmenaquinone methyltransferase/2-methoxy-6-polyprenyl-1,4-benzoquinol methylase